MEAEGSAAWARVQLARHPERPQPLDYIERLTDRFVELRGDRMLGEDRALVAGVGAWNGMTAMFLGQQRGHSLSDRLARNFGMMGPEGYRKATRLARTAARFGFPVICLIDTPGASPDAASEEHGIASAIATAITEWFEIATPVVSVVIGQGGSGGALGLAVADRVLIMENAWYSVAPPEACAAILWRDAAYRVEAAELLDVPTDQLLAAGVVDDIVPEPAGGAHCDHDRAAALLDERLRRHVLELLQQRPDVLLQRRHERFSERW
jgi:acetyl-CoA carboxylase carboxyl transferase subunit alpha